MGTTIAALRKPLRDPGCGPGRITVIMAVRAGIRPTGDRRQTNTAPEDTVITALSGTDGSTRITYRFGW